MTVKDERDWPADAILIRRHFWFIDPATLTLFQFINLLASIDRKLAGPLLHHVKLPK